MPLTTRVVVRVVVSNPWEVQPFRMTKLIAYKHSTTTKMGVPHFPVDNAHLMYNAHPVFSILTNFFNRYRAPYVNSAPENTWNRSTGCGQARI
jgi:hypothetical protein